MNGEDAEFQLKEKVFRETRVILLSEENEMNKDPDATLMRDVHAAQSLVILGVISSMRDAYFKAEVKMRTV